MKPMMILLKREWLEWKRVIIGTILVITFLNLLMLLSVSRGSNWFHETLERDGEIKMEDIKINNEEVGDVTIHMQGEDFEIQFEGDGPTKSVDKALKKAAQPIAFGLQLGMQTTFAFVLFLSLFYFSDAIYKERADNSTLFFRSLPVSDHILLGSKILAGLVGVIGLTLFLSIEYLLFARIAIMIMGEPLYTMASAVFDQISFIGLIWRWFSYLLYAAIRMAPLALFLMLVGTYVKGRPLLIGIGGPFLFAISWAIIFKSGALFKLIGKFFWGFNLAKIDPLSKMLNDADGGLSYGNPWEYIFNLETLTILLVSGLLYYGLWMIYKKNIPTG
ncbi:MAG: hypothetical protein U9Q77_04295 [Candidatus Marinimicrobia bacterium]|nr:hypothetical protein [Candidatus Neomarinimicrobiota bacterium]